MHPHNLSQSTIFCTAFDSVIWNKKEGEDLKKIVMSQKETNHEKVNIPSCARFIFFGGFFFFFFFCL